MSVVVVDNVDKPISAPWHPLHQSLAEVIESKSYLHEFITLEYIACTKQHHLHAYIHTYMLITVHKSLRIYIYIYIYFIEAGITIDLRSTSLCLVKWQLEMVMAVDPCIASISPSWQFDIEI
jgi:hypothetical protein